MSRPELPASALEWLVGSEPGVVLMPNPVRSVARRLLNGGHHVISVCDRPDQAAGLEKRLGDQPRLASLVGRTDALPLQPCVAQVVLVSGPLASRGLRPTLDAHAAHSQLSRALVPGGWVAGWQIVRDDSVPWVRRLIRLMRGIDESAMSGAATSTDNDLLTSKYFPHIERREFRIWVPIGRDDLVAMVAAQTSIAALPEAKQRDVLTEARQIFDNAASLGELRLPYQLKCWQAHVDHAELTQPIAFNDGALIIQL